jgi:hypothetical protein
VAAGVMDEGQQQQQQHQPARVDACHWFVKASARIWKEKEEKKKNKQKKKQGKN